MNPVTHIWARTPESASWHTALEIKAPETWIEIDLVAAASVSGRVVARNGGPVANADLRAVQEGIEPVPPMGFMGPRWAVPRARSGVDGEFRLTNVLPGRTSIVARSRKQGDASVILDLVACHEATCELVIGSAPSIKGVVVDENGQAVEGIEVVGRAEIGGNHNLSAALTGSDGRFELVECTSERYTVHARDPNADVNPYVRVLGVAPGGAPTRVVFPSHDRARSRITGRLVHPDGTPVATGDVSLNRFAPDGTTQWGGNRTTFEAGQFRTALLPAGRYLLALRREEAGTWTHSIELGSDQQLDLGEIEVSLPGRIELALEGVFEPDIWATIHADGMPWSYRFQVRDGRGTSEPLQPGIYRVGFGSWGGPLGEEEVQVRSGETTAVAMTLGAGVRRMVRTPRVAVDDFVLTQTWLNGEGRTIARFGWAVQRREADSPSEWLLMPGTYRVIVEAPDGRKAETSFVVTEDLESGEVIDLPSPVME